MAEKCSSQALQLEFLSVLKYEDGIPAEGSLAPESGQIQRVLVHSSWKLLKFETRGEVTAMGSLFFCPVACGAVERPVALDQAQSLMSPAPVLGNMLDFSGPQLPRITGNGAVGKELVSCVTVGGCQVLLF